MVNAIARLQARTGSPFGPSAWPSRCSINFEVDVPAKKKKKWGGWGREMRVVFGQTHLEKAKLQ